MTQICRFISMSGAVGPFPSPTKAPLLSPFEHEMVCFMLIPPKPLPIGKVPGCEFISTSCPGHMPLYVESPRKAQAWVKRWDRYLCS